MDEKLIKDAQYRKGLSIAFFNAINSAVALLSTDKEYYTEEEMKNKITVLRDWFLEEHRKYYATVIANVGVNYRADETILKLKSCGSLDELKSIWLSLSEDERRDGEIIKAKAELKKHYESLQ